MNENKGMFILGLTGPSGAGKSLAAATLRRQAFGVVDADRAARDVVAPGSACLAELTRAFGAEILLPDGSLDRKKLAAVAFAGEAGIKKLNAITHPHIMARIGDELAQLQAEGCLWAVLDAPALFEAGAERLCDKVLAVTAGYDARLVRIMRRDGLTRAQAELRLRAQKPAEFYTSRADFVLVNDGDEAAFATEVEHLAASLTARQ